MLFSELDFNSYSTWIPRIFLAVTFLFAIVTMVCWMAGFPYYIPLTTFLIVLSTGGFGWYTATQEENKNKEVYNHNVEISQENLLSKYKLKDVNWTAIETTASPVSESGNETLLVEAQDGRSYIFKYRVDRNTSEPFLKDMPINGGDAPKEAVTAESLLTRK